MNFKVAICDDEKAELEYLSMLISRWRKISDNIVDILAFDSAESFLFHYTEDKSFDILLLDIQMKNMDGIEKLTSLLVTLVMSKDAIAYVKCILVLNLYNYLIFIYTYVTMQLGDNI